MERAMSISSRLAPAKVDRQYWHECERDERDARGRGRDHSRCEREEAPGRQRVKSDVID